MRSTTLVVASIATSLVDAFWRMPCRSRTGLARLDPLVNPGSIADHVHAIHGGGNFGMTTTYEDLVGASGKKNCTSCEVLEDKSAYWTPSLHFLYRNGTSVIVPQIGGMLAYYLMYNKNLEPFPEGFRVLAGNRNQRNFTGPFPDTELSSWPTDPTDQFFLEQRALGFNCLHYNRQPEPSLYRHQFPTKEYLDANCVDGLRLELAFPSCGNGQLDSADHRSHVTYPSLVKQGNCPKGFDHHYPLLFFETIWATNVFKGHDGQFVLSHGDPVGTGYHGDFIMGWKSAAFLKQAMDTCTNDSGMIEDCPLFTRQTDAAAAQCTFDVPDILKGDLPAGPRLGLERDVPIQYGPELATKYPLIGKPGTPALKSTASSKSTSRASPALASTTAKAVSTSTSKSTTTSSSASLRGGAVVAAAASGSGAVLAVNKALADSTTTPAPSKIADKARIVTTSYLTQGNKVIEMVIEEVDVTVSATATVAAGQHKRHLHHHLQHHLNGARH